MAMERAEDESTGIEKGEEPYWGTATSPAGDRGNGRGGASEWASEWVSEWVSESASESGLESASDQESGRGFQ